jgi:hypothetical protein
MINAKSKNPDTAFKTDYYIRMNFSIADENYDCEGINSFHEFNINENK